MKLRWQNITQKKSIWPWIIPLVGLLSICSAWTARVNQNRKITLIQPEALAITKLATLYPGGYMPGHNELNNPIDIVWQGHVEELMTYGRYRLRKYPIDEEYPDFIAEFETREPQIFDIGKLVTISGRILSYECGEKCVPWVLANKMK